MTQFVRVVKKEVNSKNESLKGNIDRDKSVNPYEQRRLERLERLKAKKAKEKEE